MDYNNVKLSVVLQYTNIRIIILSMKLSEIIKEYKDAFEKAYICTVVKELGVYGIAYNFIESELKKSGSKKLFDGSYKNDWADIKEDDFMEMKLSELVNLTDGDVERIIKDEYDEELSLREDARKEYEREKELEKEFGEF